MSLIAQSTGANRNVTTAEVAGVIAQTCPAASYAGKRVLLIIPDGTRTMPMPLMFELIQQEIGARAAACDYLVALGTHPLMSDPATVDVVKWLVHTDDRRVEAIGPLHEGSSKPTCSAFAEQSPAQDRRLRAGWVATDMPATPAPSSKLCADAGWPDLVGRVGDAHRKGSEQSMLIFKIN